ncbi:MAG TPA: hypothetical protein VFP22_10115 [Candidatus Limnocylindrales bacterium]|nr:hypothetical protein [Candidatus Limnocylindrales bacterium]
MIASVPTASSAGGGAASQPAAGATASAAAAGGSGSTAGGITDFCKVFTDAEITTFLGRPAHNAGTQAATTPTNCTWQDDNLTTVWVLKSDPENCASDKDAIGSAGSAYPGADFAGPSPLGAMFAGVVAGGSCFEIEVTPTERSPKPDAVAALLQQFVQRVGA